MEESYWAGEETWGLDSEKRTVSEEKLAYQISWPTCFSSTLDWQVSRGMPAGVGVCDKEVSREKESWS